MRVAERHQQEASQKVLIRDGPAVLVDEDESASDHIGLGRFCRILQWLFGVPRQGRQQSCAKGEC